MYWAFFYGIRLVAGGLLLLIEMLHEGVGRCRIPNPFKVI